MGVDHLGLSMSLDQLLTIVRREAVKTLQNSAIGRAGMRVYNAGRILFQGGGGIQIEDGGFVNINGGGYLNIDGDLTGDGDFDWTGTLTQTGQSTFTGPTVFTGTINATGNTAWSGIMTIVGRIVAGNIEINPTDNGGTVKIGGHSLYVSGTILTLLHSSGAQVVLNNGSASLLAGGRGVSVGAAGFQFIGLPKVAKSGIPVGSVYKGGDGYIYEG